MTAAQLVVPVVVLGACLMGGVAVLLRIALERDRLVKRYDHIKAVMEYEEQIKAHQRRMQSSVAGRDVFVADVTEAATAEPDTVAQAAEGSANIPLAEAEPVGSAGPRH